MTPSRRAASAPAAAEPLQPPEAGHGGRDATPRERARHNYNASNHACMQPRLLACPVNHCRSLPLLLPRVERDDERQALRSHRRRRVIGGVKCDRAPIGTRVHHDHLRHSGGRRTPRGRARTRRYRRMRRCTTWQPAGSLPRSDVQPRRATNQRSSGRSWTSTRLTMSPRRDSAGGVDHRTSVRKARGRHQAAPIHVQSSGARAHTSCCSDRRTSALLMRAVRSARRRALQAG